MAKGEPMTMESVETPAVAVAEASDGEFREWLKGFHLRHPDIQQDPYPVYARMRSECPVFRSEMFGGFWVFSTYKDVKFIHQHPEYFSTRHIAVPHIEFPLGPEIPLHIDPPEHMKYRKPMLAMFSPAEANEAQQLVRDVAVRLLEPVVNKPSFDFLADFAVPLPCITFCELMGLPVEHLDKFLQWKDEYLRADWKERSERINEMMAGAISLFDEIYEERLHRKDPGDDIIGKLFAMPYGDERTITRNEFLRAARFIFFAGLDTTTAQLSLFVYHLAQHPELRDRITAEPSRIPAAIEELMRFDTLVGVAREVVADVELHGIQLRPGDMVLSLLNSANRDDTIFESPDEIDLDRLAANLQLGFGVGPHRCLGSHLARMEMRVALEEIHKRIPSYRIDETVPVTMHLGSVRGIDRLQLRID